jgi:hypothetical protein
VHPSDTPTARKKVVPTKRAFERRAQNEAKGVLSGVAADTMIKKSKGNQTEVHTKNSADSGMFRVGQIKQDCSQRSHELEGFIFSTLWGYVQEMVGGSTSGWLSVKSSKTSPAAVT